MPLPIIINLRKGVYCPIFFSGSHHYVTEHYQSFFFNIFRSIILHIQFLKRLTKKWTLKSRDIIIVHFFLVILLVIISADVTNLYDTMIGTTTIYNHTQTVLVCFTTPKQRFESFKLQQNKAVLSIVSNV